MDMGSTGCCVGTLLRASGEEGFGFILGLLAIPGALPPGYSSPFGLLIMVMGWQLLFGYSCPKLPNWVLNRKIQGGCFQKSLQAGLRFLSKLEGYSRERYLGFHLKIGRFWASGLVLLMGFLISLPIPFTHTVPASIVLTIGLSLSLRDGLLLFLCSVFGTIIAFFYLLLAYCLWAYGLVGIQNFFKAYFATLL